MILIGFITEYTNTDYVTQIKVLKILETYLSPVSLVLLSVDSFLHVEFCMAHIFHCFDKCEKMVTYDWSINESNDTQPQAYPTWMMDNQLIESSGKLSLPFSENTRNKHQI